MLDNEGIIRYIVKNGTKITGRGDPIQGHGSADVAC